MVFALAVLAAGLFVERFYCRYVRPLGAALAVPGRMRMFAWLRRYRDCGNPRQICANECMVQAIHPEGHINPNDCLYCLYCQVVCRDDRKSPVCVRLREKRAPGSPNRRQRQASAAESVDQYPTASLNGGPWRWRTTKSVIRAVSTAAL